jgi:hypothetical protein
MVRSKRLFILLVLCVAGALLNIAVERFFFRRLALPLYMDTPFTVAITLYGGLVPGIITGALTNPIMYGLSFYSWANYLFTLCNVATALVTALFMRLFPAELSLAPLFPKKSFGFSPKGDERFKTVMNTIMVLGMLSFALCLVLSISGGLIGAFIKIVFPQVESAGPELLFKPGLLRKHLYLVATEIISRIPLNIIDRIIAAFGGYGVAWLLAQVLPAPRKYSV